MSEAVSDQATALRHTSLYERHVAAGARLVPFADWEMPVQYAGIREEHLAVRADAGVFDVSHMGEIETTGPDAVAYLQRVLSNDVAKIVPGGAQYSVLCAEDGGAIDDLFTYRLDDARYLTVTNAANHQTDFEWFALQAAAFNVEIVDRSNSYAMLALQGPHARNVLAELLADEAPARMRVRQGSVAGVDALICGTGYTGEDGVELLLAPGDAPQVWDALLARDVTPVGLGARDTLRMEVCFHLYGNDLSRDRNPIEAGLGWCCALDTDFIGADALRPIAASGPAQKLVPFTITGRGIPRQGNPILHDGVTIGEVTSGTMSPSLAVGIGMGYVDAAFAEPGTALIVDVRGKPRAAEVRTKPLYVKPGA